ncbi:MAG: hypothetical protein Q9176_002134 [Flavoplaca citrina]
MNVLLSTAAGLLAAEAFCKKRTSTSRRAPMSSSYSSSSESSIHPSRSHHKRRGKQKNSRTRSSSIRSSPSTSSASSLSLSSSKDPTTTESDSSDLSLDSSTDSSTDSSESTVTHLHRICNGRLPKRIKYRSQLPHYNTLMTRYISPDHHSSSSNSDSSDETSSSVTTNSSSDPESSSDSSSDSESTTSNASDSSTSIIFSNTTHIPNHTPQSLPAPSALQSRLSTFLPTIRASNAELERERLDGTLRNRDMENLSSPSDTEAEGEGKPYIQMDLGLGVLEEKKKSAAGDITPLGIKRERSRDSEIRRSVNGEGTSPLETLMGRRGARTPEVRERKRRKVGIEVVD